MLISRKPNLQDNISRLKFSISMQYDLKCLKPLHIMLPVYIVSGIPVDSLIEYLDILQFASSTSSQTDIFQLLLIENKQIDKYRNLATCAHTVR